VSVKEVHPETREAALLVAFVVSGFIVGLIFLVVIVLFFMKYQ
jgi:hypothetical protein